MGVSLFQWIFPAQELNPGLLHYRQIVYQLSYEGSPLFLKPTGLSLKCCLQFHNCSLKHILNIFILYAVSDNSKIWSLCVPCANSYPLYQAAWAFYNLRLWNPVFSCFICKYLWDLGWNLFFLKACFYFWKCLRIIPICCFSVTNWRPIFCDPMNCSTPGSSVLHHLLEFAPFMSIESVMPSNHLILCLPSPFVLNLSQQQGLFKSQPFPWDGQSIGVSVSPSVLPINIQSWFPLGWIGLTSLQYKELARVFSKTRIQKHQSESTMN